MEQLMVTFFLIIYSVFLLVHTCKEQSTLENISALWYPEFRSVNSNRTVKVILTGIELETGKDMDKNSFKMKQMAKIVAREVEAFANVRCNVEKANLRD